MRIKNKFFGKKNSDPKFFSYFTLEVRKMILTKNSKFFTNLLLLKSLCARSTLGQVVPGLFHEIWVPIPLCCPSRLLPRSISLSPSCLMEHLLRPNILPPFRVVLREHKIDANANVNSFFNFSYDNIPVFEEITRVQSCDCTVFFTVSVHGLC